MKKELFWFIPPILVAIGIFALSTFFAIPIQVEGVNHLDKWEHTFAYFVLTFSFLLAFKKKGKLTTKVSVMVLLVAGFYGLSLEMIQFQFFEYRVFEWADAIANLLGAILGFLLFRLFRTKISD